MSVEKYHYFQFLCLRKRSFHFEVQENVLLFEVEGKNLSVQSQLFSPVYLNSSLLSYLQQVYQSTLSLKSSFLWKKTFPFPQGYKNFCSLFRAIEAEICDLKEILSVVS